MNRVSKRNPVVYHKLFHLILQVFGGGVTFKIIFQLACRKGKLANHKNHHFRSFIAKTNESIFHKGLKTLFLGPLGAFLALFSENEIFLEKLGSVMHNPTWSSKFMHTIKKN